ncbi:MAG: type II toxin-antitoxin system death-on-curing family toxin [Pseudomonadota bacterium]
MTHPKWLPLSFILEIHAAQIAEHGGADGLRDEGLLESACSRPLNAFNYGTDDLCALAALYGCEMIQSHPFLDGNKRTGLVALELFLEWNDLRLIASDEETLATLLALASGEWSVADLTDWLRTSVAPLP